jgi:hypothetical protein
MLYSDTLDTVSVLWWIFSQVYIPTKKESCGWEANVLALQTRYSAYVPFWRHYNTTSYNTSASYSKKLIWIWF